MTNKRLAACGAPDVLQKLGRPGFPEGMVVLLVGTAEQEQQDIAQQMHKLRYNVTSCRSCTQARLELASKRDAFDILVLEATMVAKDNREGQLLLEAACGLPLVLISSPGTTTECVWRGIEVGAADVLEKPLSLLKLQNIWQHVVRKVMDDQETCAARFSVPCKEIQDSPLQADYPAPSSRCTLSSNMSAATANRFPDDKSVVDHEASYCGSQDGKACSLDASMSNTSPENSHTVDSPAGQSIVTEVHEDGKPAKRARRSKDSSANATSNPVSTTHRPPLAIRPSSWPAQSSLATAQSFPTPASTVMGLVHPSWATTQASQAFRGTIPHGCVWGTPLNPPPGWQGTFPNGSGPLLGAAAANCNIARCHSAPVNKVDAFGTTLDSLDSLPDFDPALMVDLTDDLLLGDDFLDCGDSLPFGLGASDTSPNLAEPSLEKPPIRLTLRKSESLVNLINQHLSQCRSQQPAITAT